MRAIVFDFFGTLTEPAAEFGRREIYRHTGSLLGADPDEFLAAMSASFGERCTGAHGDTAQTLLALARRCGAEPDAERLAAATSAHRAAAAQVRLPRPGILDALDELRARGFALGLISDCSSELYEAWADTPYAPRIDTAVFSFTEGYRKPDPRLYATVAARLGTPAEECWYVGDGGSRELDGARLAGMRPVLVTNAHVPEAALHRDDPDPTTPEHVIDDPLELLALVGSGQS